MASSRLFSPRSYPLPYGCHEPILRSPFSSRDWLSNPTLVLKSSTLQEIPLFTRGLFLRFTSLLHPSSLSPAMVQRCRLQPTCNYGCSDPLVQPLLKTSEDCKPDRF